MAIMDRCLRASLGTAPARARTPSSPSAASPPSPYRQRTAWQASRSSPRPRGLCVPPRPPASPAGSSHTRPSSSGLRLEKVAAGRRGGGPVLALRGEHVAADLPPVHLVGAVDQ